jgi:hypothetical protein
MPWRSMTKTVFRLAARKPDGHFYSYGDTHESKDAALRAAPAFNFQRQRDSLPLMTHILEVVPDDKLMERCRSDRIVSVIKL